MFLSPPEAKALFTKNMDNREKLQIRSAIEAIESPKRKEVFELTQRIVCGRYCPSGREKIINAVAAKHLSVHEWHEIVSVAGYVDFGLNCGEDVAKILLAVAQLPLERRDFCRLASCWFNEKMPVGDRILILNAFHLIRSPEELREVRGLIYGLETGREIALVVSAATKIPENKMDLLWSTGRKIVGAMSAEKRVELLEEGELSGWFSHLDSKTLSNKERLELKRAIEAFPDKTVDISYLAFRLVTEEMGCEDRLLILNALIALPSQERAAIYDFIRNEDLISPAMNARDRVRVIDLVRAVPINEREAIGKFTNNLITMRMRPEDKFKVLKAVLAIPPQERDAIDRNILALDLFNVRMSGEEYVSAINALLAIPPQEREGLFRNIQDLGLFSRSMNIQEKIRVLNIFCLIPLPQREDMILSIQGLGLISHSMNAEDRLRVLNTIFAIPPQDREAIYNFIRGLITEGMGAEDRIKILNGILALVPQEREAIYTCSRSLITNSMNADDRLRILDAVRALPSQERETVCDCAHSLSTNGMNVEERVAVLNEILALPRDAREAIYYRNCTELVVDRDRLVEDPTVVLETLLAIYDAQKLFPKIRFKTAAGVDDIGVDAGGMSRGVVTDLMQALWHPKPTNIRTLPILALEGGVVPKIEDASDLKPYRGVGMIFAMALNGARSILTGNHFSPTLFKMIHALTQEEMDQIPENLNSLSDIPEQIRNKLLKLYLKSELRLVFGDPRLSQEDLEIAIHNFVDNNTINNWMSEVNGIETKEAFLASQGLKQILFATFVIAKSMQQRLSQPNNWDVLKGAASEELRKGIEGSLSKDQVRAALTFQDLAGQRSRFIMQWIEEATEKELEEFVFCIANSTTLKPDQSLRITLVPDHPERPVSQRLPVFHTCSFQMDLPMYEEYENFKEKLAQSIRLILDGNIGGGLA